MFLVVDGGQGYNPEYYILHISMWNDKFVYRIAVLSPNRLMAHWRYGHNPVNYGTPYSIQLIRLLSETQEKVINKTFVNCYPFGLRQKYFRRTRSITAWFLMSPGHHGIDCACQAGIWLQLHNNFKESFIYLFWPNQARSFVHDYDPSDSTFCPVFWCILSTAVIDGIWC